MCVHTLIQISESDFAEIPWFWSQEQWSPSRLCSLEVYFFKLDITCWACHFVYYFWHKINLVSVPCWTWGEKIRGGLSEPLAGKVSGGLIRHKAEGSNNLGPIDLNLSPFFFWKLSCPPPQCSPILLRSESGSWVRLVIGRVWGRLAAAFQLAGVHSKGAQSRAPPLHRFVPFLALPAAQKISVAVLSPLFSADFNPFTKLHYSHGNTRVRLG